MSLAFESLLEGLDQDQTVAADIETTNPGRWIFSPELQIGSRKPNSASMMRWHDEMMQQALAKFGLPEDLIEGKRESMSSESVRIFEQMVADEHKKISERYQALDDLNDKIGKLKIKAEEEAKDRKKLQRRLKAGWGF